MNRIAVAFRHFATDPRPDGELLAAFLGNRDDAAFGELVRRHGPTVWGVCRRALPNLADAEDAFQATFLVLARRAGRLVAAPTIGPWLFEVAARTAANARRKNTCRRALFAELPDALADPRPPVVPPPDLDAMLLGLPRRYRAVLLMCYLEGLTHREAADRLGCAEGTVSSLVSRGLAKLRTKFAGRAPAAVLVAAGGAVPMDLTAAAVRSAVLFRIGFPSAAVPPAIVALTRGVLLMFWIKRARASAIVAALLLGIVTGFGLLVGQSPRVDGQDPPFPKKEPAPAHPRPVRDGVGKGQPDKSDGKETPNGHWLLVAKETNGKRKDFPQGIGIVLVISDDEFKIIEEREPVFGTGITTATISNYSWKPAATTDGKPRALDLVFKTEDKVAWKEGIYKLDGDKLILCWGEEKRPTDFTTKPDSGRTLNVFQRLDARPSRTPAGPPEPVKEAVIDGKTFGEWVELLNGEDIVMRQGAVLHLAKFGPRAVPDLAGALSDKMLVNRRIWAAHALGNMGSDAKVAAPQLTAALKDDSTLVRIQAARALWKVAEDKAAVTALHELPTDTDVGIRYGAVVALGEIGPPAKAAVPALVRALKDDGLAGFRSPTTVEYKAVCEAAAKALKKVDPATARKHGIE